MSEEYHSPYEYYAAISEHDYEKPVVEYSLMDLPVVVGDRAYVITYNHPAKFLNVAPFVMTTQVLSYDEETGDFTTKNTHYVLKK